MEEDEVETFKYRWISGIRGHMHVITGGVDMHVAFDDRRVLPESTEAPDPTNGFRGFVAMTEALPARPDYSGLYAVSMMSPFDEFLVVDYAGAYRGRLNRGRDGLYTVFPLDRPCDPRNQRFQSIPEALQFMSGVLADKKEDADA